MQMKVGDTMAKQRKKRKVKNSAPPLSKLDKFIYIFIITVSIIILTIGFVFCLNLPETLAFSDEDVVLYAERWTLLLQLPLFLFLLIAVIGFFEEAMSDRRPIFGKNDADYRTALKICGVHYLFEKKKQKKILNENEKNFRIVSRIVLVVICVFSILLGIGGFFGRTCLHYNGHIKVYSIVNTVKNEYTLGDFSQVTVESGEESVGKHDWRPTCYFNIETDNGKEFLFSMNDNHYAEDEIGKKLENMLQLKEYYESQGIAVSIDGVEYIDQLIEYYEMTDSEKELLYKLFEINE